MGVNICECDKRTEKSDKELFVDWDKKNSQTNNENIITVNRNNNIIDDKSLTRMKYIKIFNENGNSPLSNIKPVLSSTLSNNNNTSNQTLKDEKIQNIIKIQSCFRAYLVRKKNINKNMNKTISNNKNYEEIFEEEESISYRKNIDVAATVFSNINNSEISQDNNSKRKKNNNGRNLMFPFNIKNKLKTNYKYSGYIHKKKKNKEEKEIENSSSSDEEKESNDNEEKSEIIKEGFGKFIFNDGTEFCGIFHNNILQNYGKYTNMDQRDKANKEIIITNNFNYEEFIGEYKDYILDGFGVYKNYITNLKITGIFKDNNICGIGIEDSAEGGYVYRGEFVNNQKEGYGTIEWKDGAKYQGEFKENQINGYGIIEYPDDKFYQGEVKNGKMEGFGEFFWKDEKKYIGNYRNDKRNGFGIFIFKENEQQNNLIRNSKIYKTNSLLDNLSAYLGFWKNGSMDGFGMIVTKDEIKYGLWENGIKRKNFGSNFALKTYLKWIDKKYVKFFLRNHLQILEFLRQCVIIEKDINPIIYKSP
jgi:hypothetical protein